MKKLLQSSIFFVLVLLFLATFCGCATEKTDSLPTGSLSKEELASSPCSDDGDLVTPSKERPFISQEESEPSEAPSPEPSFEESTSIPTETDFALRLSDAVGAPGAEITVSLLAEHNPGIAGYSVTVLYDPQILTVVKCQNKVKDGFCAQNKTVAGKIRVMCTVMGKNTLVTNGTLDEITFQVSKDAPAGTIPLKLVLQDAADEIYRLDKDYNMPSVACNLYDGSLTISQ